MTSKKRANQSDPWEDRRLGADERFVGRLSAGEQRRIDQELGLQMISIRLPVRLIEQLKVIAQHTGIGYQPLMRNVLSRFASGELIEVLRQQTEIVDLQKRKKDVRDLKGIVSPARGVVTVREMNRSIRKAARQR